MSNKPEEANSDKEQENLFEEIIKRTTEQFPREIMELWSIGKSPKEIAEVTGKPIKTIYRVLREMQKAIIKNSLSEIETRGSRIQSSQSEIESEKRITRSILDELRTE